MQQCLPGAMYWHAIIPTTVAAETPTHKEVEESLAGNPQGTPTAPAASRYGMLTCSLCNTCIAGAKDSLFALRVIMAYDGNGHIKVFPARICMTCVTKPTTDPGEDHIEFWPHDHTIHSALMKYVFSLSQYVILLGTPPSGDVVWKCIMHLFYGGYQEWISQLGPITKEGKEYLEKRFLIPKEGTYAGVIGKTHVLHNDWI